MSLQNDRSDLVGGVRDTADIVGSATDIIGDTVVVTGGGSVVSVGGGVIRGRRVGGVGTIGVGVVVLLNGDRLGGGVSGGAGRDIVIGLLSTRPDDDGLNLLAHDGAGGATVVIGGGGGLVVVDGGVRVSPLSQAPPGQETEQGQSGQTTNDNTGNGSSRKLCALLLDNGSLRGGNNGGSGHGAASRGAGGGSATATGGRGSKGLGTLAGFVLGRVTVGVFQVSSSTAACDETLDAASVLKGMRRKNS